MDKKYMEMALKLAGKGVGAVEPNPAVGCVIVKGTQVVGKGWHKKFGEDHAEIVALASCKELGVNPKGSTMYVTLEPCCHHGKTGPCTEAVIAAGVKKVFVATVDPSEHVEGKGIEMLKEAGVEVEVGLCESKARMLNAGFIKKSRTGKSWVILKWAQSIDGKCAWKAEAGRRWISNEKSRSHAHNLRRRSQAVVVGINTVLADDPQLLPRPAKGRKPLRLVLDNRLRMPLDCELVKTVRKGPVTVVCWEGAAEEQAGKVQQLHKSGVEVVIYPDTGGESNLKYVMEYLDEKGVQQVLVEGGPTVIRSFLQEGLADEICVYVAPVLMAGAGGADIGASFSEIERSFGIENCSVEEYEGDVCISGFCEGTLESVLEW